MKQPTKGSTEWYKMMAAKIKHSYLLIITYQQSILLKNIDKNFKRLRYETKN